MNTFILFTLPVILLLVHSVHSADLYKTKRAPRDVKELRAINSNHPPSVETYVPVAVIYDKEEDISVLSKNIPRVKSTTKENEGNLKSSNGVLNADENYGNYSPAVEQDDPIKIALVTDEEESVVTPATENKDEITPSTELDQTTYIEKPAYTESVIKPKGRSLNYKTTTSKVEIESSTSSIPTKERTLQRRVQRVKKVKLNKIIATVDNKTADTTQNKGIQSRRIDQTYKNDVQPTTNTKFQKRTQQRDPVVPIVNSENYVFAYNGDYHYSYEGGDGTKAFEKGESKTAGGGSSGADVVGGYSYTDKEGNDFSLSYTADENGYRPVGAHLPTPPPIPIAIQRALAYLATKTTPEPVTERIKSH